MPGSATTALPPALAEKLAAGVIRRVVVIGQGTAAVAGMAMVDVLAGLAADGRLAVRVYHRPPSCRASA